MMETRTFLFLVVSCLLTGRTGAEQGDPERPLFPRDARAADNLTTESVPAECVFLEYPWRFSGGILYRRFDRISFRSGTRSSQAAISANPFGDKATHSIPRDSASGYADRSYDDGFVNQDPGTAINGDTWYWGYSDSGQVSDDSIQFHRDLGVEQSLRTESSTRSGGWNDESLNEPALFVEAERCFQQVGGMTFGTVVDAMYATLGTDHRHSTFSADQYFVRSSVSINDSYELLGVIPPDAPYSGTYDGPGPLLGNIPDGHVVLTDVQSRQTTHYENMIHETLDVDLLTLGVGVSVMREVGRLAVSLAAGPSLNIVEMKASYDERLTGVQNGVGVLVSEWQASEKETDVAVGAFGHLVINWAVTGRLRLGLVGRYDWLKAIDGSVGPSVYDMSFKGWSCGAMLGWVY